MKKVFSVFVILAVIISLTGCLSVGEVADSAASQYTEPSVDAAVDSVPAYEEVPDYSDTAEYSDESYEAPDSVYDVEEYLLWAEGGNTCKNLTDADVRNYYSNRFDIYDASYDLMESGYSGEEILAGYDAILKDCGISGPNRYGKLCMIEKCDQILTTINGILSNPVVCQQYRDAGIDPEEMAETIVSAQKELINDADYEVVKRNWIY